MSSIYFETQEHLLTIILFLSICEVCEAHMWTNLLVKACFNWKRNFFKIITISQTVCVFVKHIPRAFIYCTKYLNQSLLCNTTWDYDTYHIGDQRRLRQACASAQSRQSLHCSHTWSMEVDEGSDQKSDIWPHWVDTHARLKNEFTEDKKCHNLMRWLNFTCNKLCFFFCFFLISLYLKQSFF